MAEKSDEVRSIGEGVTSILYRAFENCSALTEVTIPNSVTSMDEGYHYNSDRRGVFANCTALTTVTIGDGLSRIPGLAFYNCPALVNLTIGNGVTVIGWRAFPDFVNAPPKLRFHL